jgi:alpha-tubulin suppressor-like RCC1 family protein
MASPTALAAANRAATANTAITPRATSGAGGPSVPGNPQSPLSQASPVGAAAVLGPAVEPLFYRKGTVQHAPNVHVIFWGSSWNEEKPSKLREQLMAFYKGLTGSAWQGILTQYFDEKGYISSTVAASKFTDERVSAPAGVDGNSLANEIAEAITLQNEAAKLTGETPWAREHDAEFVVIPSPRATYGNIGTGFCAFHTIDGAGSSWTFLPDLEEGGFTGCRGENLTSAAASHEYAESATDPYFGGWFGGSGSASEIGDLCGLGVFRLETTDKLNGSFVQTIADDNLASTCELSDPEPPHVLTFTEPATNVGVYEATLNGLAYPENLETSYRFEYGPTKKYGESISAGTVSAGSGFTLQPVQAVLPGLQQGATYHYRLAATNSQGGTTFGRDQKFTVPFRKAGLLAWGGNGSGELGNGTTTSSSEPVNVSGLSEVKALAGGSSPVSSQPGFTLALLPNGTVEAWGENTYGQLGNGTTANSSVPVLVKEREGKGIPPVTAVAAGGGHSLALLANGTVMAWGDNEAGELGNGTTTNSSVPVKVSPLKEVTAIAAAGRHSLALLANGTVMAWGENREGQLGNGTTTSSSVPVKVSNLSEGKALSAGDLHDDGAAGRGFSVALLKSGKVMAWGTNFLNQLGQGEFGGKSTVPVEVSGLSEVTAIASGNAFSLALLQNGTVKSWGANTEGVLGVEIGGPTLFTVTNLSEVASIAASGRHAMALLRNGTLATWGDNEFGELGNGTTTSSFLPATLIPLIGVTTIAAGNDFSAAYAPLPTVTKVEPNTGPTTGGTSVTITGTGFTVAKAVKFGSANAASFRINSGTSMTAVSPPGTGTVDVTVTTPGITSPISSADQFRYG